MTKADQANLEAGVAVAVEIFGEKFLMDAEDNGLYDLFGLCSPGFVLTEAQRDTLTKHGWQQHGTRWQYIVGAGESQ